MSSSPPSRHRRVHPGRRTGRKLALSAAALVVTLAPAACNYAAAEAPPSSNGSATVPAGGHGGDHGGVTTTGPVVVPVGNTSGPTTGPVDDPTGDRADDRADDRGDNRTRERGAADPADLAATPDGDADPTTDPADADADADAAAEPTEPAVPTATGDPAPPPDNGLQILGDDCSDSALAPHDGFQLAPRCVDTAFGEVAAADRSPSLLITEAPDGVAVGETFTIRVSTRNLVRDRFLGAAAGGYYLESSFLDGNGLQRGHFHTACRMLQSTDVAPDAAPAPAFFLATQDNGGGADPDVVTITVTGLPTAGTAQCAVWAGDGSHRVPMMERANQTPAFDAVRIEVG